MKIKAHKLITSNTFSGQVGRRAILSRAYPRVANFNLVWGSAISVCPPCHLLSRNWYGLPIQGFLLRNQRIYCLASVLTVRPNNTE
jgi:hypothetical protein